METRTYNVYKFNELTKEGKEKAIELWRQNNQYDFLSEYLNEVLTELLLKNNIQATKKNLFYSLSNCQGDGAMFTLSGKWKNYQVTVLHSGRYYHYNSKDIFIETMGGNDASEKVYEQFNKLYVKICKKIEKIGYDYIDDENKEENIIETFEANGYLFTADGNID